MKVLRYTLLSEGHSDTALIPHPSWLLRQNGVSIPVQATWADLRRVRDVPKGLTARIKITLELYPCDLFVHRDADREGYEIRKEEIFWVLEELQAVKEKSVCVVPVKMQEAWQLLDTKAIRYAAGNPNGSETILLPKLSDIEDEPDPKTLLHNLLKTASGLSGRRLKKFNFRHGASQVYEFIEDFSLLRNLFAFKALESDVKQIITQQRWNKI